MTREEAISILKAASYMSEKTTYGEYKEAVNMAISALKAQTDGDTISRQLAMDAPVKMVSEGLDWIPVYHIKGLPSVQPEPSQVARDIATIVENEQDMRVVLKNAQNDIIRCKDCKYYDPNDHCYLQGAEADDFCSYAERRADEY